MIGRTVSHYRILSPLGAGGMGVVYLAEDERLGRQVALKFLPATWSQEKKALERFRVEARAASLLSHPAICAIYDIGQDGDTPFIVMEALKGETLRERIAKGPLKVADVVDIGMQLADALEAAHSQGIVHRDIKPANIFLGERNRVKVLDFGLAKLTSPSSTSFGLDRESTGTRTEVNNITQPGTALGTVSYMSPEQARGEEIDSRTDLFSLGAVMYEMVTGSQAFGGSTAAVVFDAILNRAPRPVAQLNPLVPPRLEAVITTALEKDRELRYQHASDMQAELRRVRRDLESGTVSPLASVTSRPSAATVTTSIPQVNAATRRWERAAIVFALLAVVIAGFWIWRGQRSENTDGATVAVVPQPDGSAPVPAQPPTADPAPEGQAPRSDTTTETSSSDRAAARPPREQPAPSTSTTPSQRAATAPAPQTRTPDQTSRPASTPPAPSPSTAVSTPAPLARPTPTLPVNPPPNTNPVAENAKPLPAPPLSAPTVAPSSPPATSTVAQSPPPAAAAPAAAESARGAAPPESRPPSTPAASAAETDDAAIRRVIRTYEQAIETKDVDLYRSVRPGLTKAAESVLQNSFRQVTSQEVEIRVDNLTIQGRTATARISRRDTLVTNGRRQAQNSTQTLRFEKTDNGWIIAE